MSGGFANMNGGGFGAKPRALMCYICGREYGTASLQIHLKTCMKKWEIEEGKKPKKERRPMPQPPKQLMGVLDKLNAGGNVNMNELEDYNNKANDEYNDSALIRCDFCNRTFLPERLGIHRKICTEEKPFKPLPPPANKGGKDLNSTQTSASTSKSTMSSMSKPSGGGSQYGGQTGGGGGGGFKAPSKPQMGGGGGKPSYGGSNQKQQQFEEEEDDYQEEEEVYKQAKPVTQSKPQAKPMGGARQQNYANMGGEFEEVALEECDLCGRKFAADRLARHQKACTKVQKGEAKHAKRVAQAEKKQLENEKFIAKEQKYKKSNWREQHKEFVENMKYNRKIKAVEESGGDIRSLGPAPQMASTNSNFVECPYCARKFNPTSAEKHINICKNVVNKPKAVPGKSMPVSQNPYGGAPPSKMNSTKTGFGSPPTGKNTFGTPAIGGSKYGPNNYGNPFSGGGDSYSGNNFGGGGGGMGGTKTGFGSARQQPGGMGQQSSMPKSPSGVTKMTSPMSNTKGGGFGMGGSKQSSLATAGKMAMQGTYSSYPSSGKTGNVGYRY